MEEGLGDRNVNNVRRQLPVDEETRATDHVRSKVDKDNEDPPEPMAPNTVAVEVTPPTRATSAPHTIQAALRIVLAGQCHRVMDFSPGSDVERVDNMTVNALTGGPPGQRPSPSPVQNQPNLIYSNEEDEECRTLGESAGGGRSRRTLHKIEREVNLEPSGPTPGVVLLDAITRRRCQLESMQQQLQHRQLMPSPQEQIHNYYARLTQALQEDYIRLGPVPPIEVWPCFLIQTRTNPN